MIRVLIADEMARIVGDLDKLAAFGDAVEVCGIAHQPSSVIEEAGLRQPDVLLVHETFADLAHGGLAAQLDSVSPATRVLLMTAAGEATGPGGWLAGVIRDNAGGAALVEAIQAAAGVSRARDSGSNHDPGSSATTPIAPRGRATVIVAFSGKGGTGTSTVAANLAVALAGGVDGRAALIDADLQFGDLATMLHVETHLLSIADLAQHGESIDPALLDDVLATGPGEVRVLRSASSPELATLVTASGLRAILRATGHAHEFVVVDTPSHLDEHTLEAFELADHVLLVTSSSLTAIRSTKASLGFLEALGVSRDRVEVVLNHTSSRVGHRREDIEEVLGRGVIADLPYDPEVELAVDTGTAIVRSDPRAELSRRIVALALRLAPAPAGTAAGLVEVPATPPAPIYRRRFSLGRR
ncbi:MAG TPA: P-loop NTPase [Candidatus Dormibacteraeota bacterium]